MSCDFPQHSSASLNLRSSDFRGAQKLLLAKKKAFSCYVTPVFSSRATVVISMVSHTHIIESFSKQKILFSSSYFKSLFLFFLDFGGSGAAFKLDVTSKGVSRLLFLLGLSLR